MSPSADSQRRRPGLWLPATLALAAVVRWSVIGRDALWLDEGYTWWDARQSLAALWSVVPQCDPHPPLYFVLLHEWIRIAGDGTPAMRMLSLVFGCATVAAVFMAGRELDAWRERAEHPFGIGPMAAVLFALTPFQIYFSIEARPYALLCLAAALMTWGALRLVRTATRACGSDASSPKLARISRGGWWLLVSGAAIALWTNNTAVLLVGALSMFFVLWWIVDRASRASIAPLLAAGVAVLLIWAPDLPLLLQQSREVAGDFWIAPPNYQRLRFELHYLVGLDNYEATWWMVLAMLGGVALVARRISWRAAALLLAVATLPLAFNLAISTWMSPILISRALIGIAPAFTLALAAGVVLIRIETARIAAAIALVAAHGLATAGFVAADHVKEPWKPLVARLATVAKDARVLVIPNELALPLAHQAAADGLALRVRGVPADYPAIGLPMRYPSGKCAPSAVGQSLDDLARELRTETAVVLLTRRNNTYDPEESVAQKLRGEGFTLRSDDVFQPGDLRVMRFTRSP